MAVSLRIKEALVDPEERLMDGDAFGARWPDRRRRTTPAHDFRAHLEIFGTGVAG